MRTNINRFKQRTDYTRTINPRQPSTRASTLATADVLVAKQAKRLRPRGEVRNPAAPVIASSAPPEAAPRAEFPDPSNKVVHHEPRPKTAKTTAYPIPVRTDTKVATAPVDADSSTLSMHLSLPTFRQPPTTEQAPSAQTWRLIFIVLVGLAFFTFGYHNLWHMLH